jgi:hypothetical protein
MKCLILLFALLLPACSHFTERGRLDRAYYKHMKDVRVAREQRRACLMHDVARMPSPATPPALLAKQEGPVSVSVSSGDQ